MEIYADHVAVLVESIETYVESIDSSWTRGPIDRFESEGTAEMYLGDDPNVRVLLLEAISDGPYRDALNKRGPGLHHIGFNTPNVEEALATFSGSGWYLHPKSIKTFRTLETVWLVNKDAKFLLELHQSTHKPSAPSELIVPANERAVGPLPAIAGASLSITADGNVFSVG